MISEVHWKVLQKTNRMLKLNWETLVKARIEGDQKRIKLAEMSYFQSLRSVLCHAKRGSKAGTVIQRKSGYTSIY